MDSRCQWEALTIEKICFDPTSAAALGRVEMDGYENGVGIRIGDRNARSKWHEDVAVAGHHDSISARCQRLFQSLSDIKGHLLFCNALARNPTAVISSMTGIDYYGST